TPLWQFYRLGELNADVSNWFGPNRAAVVQAFESAGFAMQTLKHCGRSTFHGRVKAGPPEFLTIGTTEGIYYDTVSNPRFGPGDELGMTAAHSWSFSERFQIAILCSPEYYRKHGN